MKGWWIAVAVVLLLAGCRVEPVGSIVVDTPRKGWCEAVELRYDNADTLGVYTIGVVLSVENDLVAESVALRVGCTSPSGATTEGRLVLTAPERHSGGSFTELAAEWVSGARLPESGDYLFTLTPEKEQNGVWMAGVSLRTMDLENNNDYGKR